MVYQRAFYIAITFAAQATCLTVYKSYLLRCAPTVKFCWKFRGIMMFKAIFFGLLMSLSMVNGGESDCSYNQKMETGKSYYVYNPEYPDKYRGENHCTWTASSPYTIKINCTIDIPPSRNCVKDSISITSDGRDKPDGSDKYCGHGEINIYEEKSVTIKLNTDRNTEGGKFLCELRAENHLEQNCRCGWKNPTDKIVGGKETGVNEYPMMAGIVNIKNKLIYCGCIIISEKYVITAAHCVENENINRERAIVVGEHDVRTGKETNATKLYRIKHCNTHPGYNDMHNDIAVCEIDGKIEYSNRVGPVCLPFQHSNDSFGGDIVIALGWGLLDFGGRKSDTLQEVDLNVMTLPLCKEYYPDINSSNMCTYTPEKDACQMDSGGPLLWQNPTTHNLLLVGIISSGTGCATDIPALYTRVGAYMKWIQSVTPGVQYCEVE